jgi:hypothetical protein
MLASGDALMYGFTRTLSSPHIIQGCKYEHTLLYELLPAHIS